MIPIQRITLSASANFNPSKCNFIYGQNAAVNTCDRDKGHGERGESHHDSRTGVTWTNTFTVVLPTTTAAIAPGHCIALPG